MASPYVLFNGVTIPAGMGGILLNGAAVGSASAVALPQPFKDIYLNVSVAVASTNAYQQNNPAYGLIRFFWFTTPFTVTNTNVPLYCKPDAFFEYNISEPMGGHTYYFNRMLPPALGTNCWLWIDTQDIGVALTLTAQVQESATATQAWV